MGKQILVPGRKRSNSSQSRPVACGMDSVPPGNQAAVVPSMMPSVGTEEPMI
ncbi:MAG TPA: hypothetical protein VFE24_01235 [Pirellulales bacterium]|nr:hypothetical protein [Pirellulales bacterium]